MHARRRNESDTYRRAHAHILFYKYVIQLFNGKRTRTESEERRTGQWKNEKITILHSTLACTKKV